MEQRKFWSLNKLIALAVLAGMALLLIEIRWEHREVLSEKWESWIPLVYVGVMLVSGLAALRFCVNCRSEGFAGCALFHARAL